MARDTAPQVPATTRRGACHGSFIDTSIALPVTLHHADSFATMQVSPYSLSALLLLFSTAHAFPSAAFQLKSSSISSTLGSMHGEHLSATIDMHTHIKLRRYTSTRFVQPGQRVACVSLSNIEVHPDSRRQGHARSVLRKLRTACSDNNAVLVVENVVSNHMHALIAQLQGAALPGSRPGAKGCNYWLPPKNGAAWQDFAMAA